MYVYQILVSQWCAVTHHLRGRCCLCCMKYIGAQQGRLCAHKRSKLYCAACTMLTHPCYGRCLRCRSVPTGLTAYNIIYVPYHYYSCLRYSFYASLVLYKIFDIIIIVTSIKVLFVLNKKILKNTLIVS
jgi:hypothetical protein